MHNQHKRKEECNTWSQSTKIWIYLCSLVLTSFLDTLSLILVAISYFITKVEVYNCNICEYEAP